MNLQEYQAKEFFKAYNIPTLNSKVISSSHQVDEVAQHFKSSVLAVKAQILAGGRGKAGGIKIVKTNKELKQAVQELIGQNLVTPQTSKEGEKIEKVLIEEGCSIKQEYYLSCLIHPKHSKAAFIVSKEGGMDIEEVTRFPDKILQEIIHPFLGVSANQAWSIGSFLGVSDQKGMSQILPLLRNIYSLFVEKEATLLEINPLVQDTNGQFLALDGKMSCDENALFRHKDLKEIYWNQPRKPSEKEALENNLSFIELEGNIGCMVNGAGLAMATMDMIQIYGGKAANFLDVGGGADELKVKKAFEIILKSKELKAILVNIFGGIMRCDVLALGLIKAIKEVGLKVPVVIRLEGTKSKEALKLLRDSKLNLIPANTLDEAAKQVVEVAK